MFRVLYTKQLLKKRKTYHDGTLRTHPTRNIAVLHSDSDDVLCEVVCNLDKVGYACVIDRLVSPRLGLTKKQIYSYANPVSFVGGG